MNKKKIIKIIHEALEHRGFSSTEANKFISFLTKIEYAKEESSNIFNDCWGSRGPDCSIGQLATAK